MRTVQANEKLSSKRYWHFAPLMLALGLLAGLIALLQMMPAWAAPTHFVKPGGKGDCSSWEDACDLQEALTKAAEGSEIWVASGVYTPITTTTEEDPCLATFQLKAGVRLYGGFVGDETVLEARDFVVNVTVLSGDIDGNDSVDADGVVTDTKTITGTNACHVITSRGLTETAVLDGFTITAGNAVESHGWGGGIYNDYSNPTLTNITVSGNSANYSGGGMYNFYSDPMLTNIIISGNFASQYAGGMYNEYSDPILTNVTFSGNSTSGDGGGMYNELSSPTLTYVVFKDNFTEYESSGEGGGMYNSHHSNPTLTNVIFSGNSARNGGGMDNFLNSLTLTNVIFSGNSAQGAGGGMKNFTSSLTLTNVTFGGNSAQDAGGGVYNDSESNLVLTNCILWGNVAPENGQIFNNNDATSILNYSLVQGGCPDDSACDEHLLTGDPCFVDADGDLHLQGNSPAIDAGNNTATGLIGITSDLDGKPRFMDVPIITDTGYGTPPIVDLGAYEYDARVSTTIQLDAVPNPSQLGQTVTFTATLSATGSELSPGDSVAFYVDEEVPYTVDLDEHSLATYARDDLGVGSHTITVQYAGNADFAPSASAPLNLMVDKQNSQTSLKVSPNPVVAGQVITLVASVSTVGNGTIGMPTGKIDFYTGETLLGSSDLDQVAAVLTTSVLGVGSHTLTSQYNGDTDFAASTSFPVSLLVKPPNLHLPLVLRNWPPVVILEDAPDLCADAYPIQMDTHAYQDDFDARVDRDDADWYRIEVSHGNSYLAEVRDLGSNLLPVLLLYDGGCYSVVHQGTQIGDSTRLSWTHEWPSGPYHLLVYEAYGRSGTETGYELSVKTNP